MLTIMVVDDSIVIRKMITTELEKMGHKVIAQATNGQEAIDLYKEYLPNFVTMDITMPGINGMEAFKKIKSLYSDANILMVTSRGEERLVIEAIKSGAKGYMLKPITTKKLADSIIKIFPNEC